MSAIVTLKDVNISYPSGIAIEGANLEIFADEFIGIIGPNGGGKTSLIKSILGEVE